MKNTLTLVSLLLVIRCTTPTPKPSAFADAFITIPMKDTLVFSLAFEANASASLKPKDTIETETFYENVPDSVRVVIEHILDAGEPIITRLGRFPIDAEYEALGIDIQVSWFKNQSLLLFNKKTQNVTAVLPMAEFYGGDGGQILRKSWILSSSGTAKTWIVRESQHTLSMEENADEPQDLYAEWVAKYAWQKNNFVVQPTPDSTELIRYFPINWE